MRQIALIPSGCTSHGGTSVSTSDEKYLYYASTLAVYCLNKKTFAIEKILSSSERPIRHMTVSPHGNDMLATSSMDGTMACWNVENEDIICKTKSSVSTDRFVLDWDPHNPNRILMVTCNGLLKGSLWQVDGGGSTTVCFQVSRNGPQGTVARWNPKTIDQFAIGTTEGHIVLFDTAKKEKSILQSDKGARVVDVQWDRLSSIYLLAAYTTYISLWDTESKTEMHVFENQGTKITGLGWLDWTAGNFISTNALTGVVKIWNASQKQPLDTIRVSAQGILAVHMEHGTHRALLSCADGNFQVYNVTRKRIEFEVGAGHTETIFDTAFSTHNPDMFASCSFDGTIKIWQTCDQKLLKTIHAADTAIYKVSWNLNDTILAGCTFVGTVVLCDVESGRKLATYDHHHTKPSFCVQFSDSEQDLVCSTSLDCTAKIFQVDSSELQNASSPLATTGSRKISRAPTAVTQIVATLKHPGGVFGCAWCPHNTNLIATACLDTVARVWDYSSNTCVYLLKGHTDRVFNVAWSHVDGGLLATTSDDREIRLWDIDLNVHTPALKDKKNINVSSKLTLKGHTKNVRALTFNHEIKDLLISGSWDSSVRAWHVGTGQCLEVAHAHVADVYAFTSHPRRPFNYISCSRDTTMRLWELEGVVRRMRMTVMTEMSFASVGSAHQQDNKDTFHSTAIAPFLIGKESAVLEKELDKRKVASIVPSSSTSIDLTYAYAALFNFFCGPNGSTDLWSVTAKHVKESGGGKARPFGLKIESSRIHHETEIVSKSRAVARKLESAKMTTRKTEVTGKAAEQLALAALEYAKMGDFRSYCKTMISLDRWKDALALAPAVGVEFWQELCREYAAKNSTGASEEFVPFLVGIGDEAAAGEALFSRGDFASAMVVAKGAEDRCAKGEGAAESTESGMSVTRRPVDQWTSKGSEDTSTQRSLETDTGDDGGVKPSGVPTPGKLPPLSSLSGGGKALSPLRKDLSPLRGRGGGADDAAPDRSNPGERTARPRASFTGATDNKRERRARVLRAAAKNAAQLTSQGEPLLAAAQYMAVGEVSIAIQMLLSSGEPDMAMAVARCTGVMTTPDLYLKLADSLISYEQVALARSVLQDAQALTGDEDFDVDCRLALMMRRHAQKTNFTTSQGGKAGVGTDEAALDSAMVKAGLKPAAWWAGRAKEELAVGADLAGLRCLVAAGSAHSEVAARQGLAVLSKAIRDPLHCGQEAEAVLGVMHYLDAHSLPDGTKENFLATILWFSAHTAATYGDWDTGHNLLSLLSDLVQKGTRFAIPVVELRFQMLFFSIASGRQAAIKDVKDALQWSDLQEDQRSRLRHVLEFITAASGVKNRVPGSLGGPWGDSTVQVYKELVRFGDSMSLPSLEQILTAQMSALESSGAIGLSSVSGCGSNLPTPSQILKSTRSMLSGQKILARGRMLDDGTSIISFNEYLAWKRVCAFSPTLSGAFI